MSFRRFITLLLMVGYMETAYGQEIFNFGIYGRANMSSPEHGFIDFDKCFSGDVGFLLETGWTWGYLEYGIGYSNVGMKYEAETVFMLSKDASYSENSKFHYKAKAHCIDIPVAIAFRLANKKGFGVSIDGGGYLSVGVCGKITVEENLACYSYNIRSYNEDRTYTFDLYGNKTYQYKRLDAGWKVGAKVHLGRCVRVGMEYRRGLINLSNLEGTTLTNSIFNMGLTLMLGHWGKKR